MAEGHRPQFRVQPPHLCGLGQQGAERLFGAPGDLENQRQRGISIPESQEPKHSACGRFNQVQSAMNSAVMQAIESERGVFIQSIDVSRPHTLLTKNTKWSGSLVFRYDDTGELVNSPNVPYNQTFQVRAEAIRWDADRLEAQGAALVKNPPYLLTPAAVSQQAARIKLRVARIREEANRMHKQGQSTHPVAASRITLDYGPNAF